MTTSDTGGSTLELAVRTLSPRGCRDRQTEAVRRLNALADRGVVDDVSVTVWGDRVPTTTEEAETDHARSVLDAVDEYAGWAADHGLSVDPFFETREAHSAFTGESSTAMELPAMVLAEYRGGELYWVSPCVDGEETYTVGDRLSTLENTAVDLTGEVDPPVAPPVAEE
jgi:hypothetical protein